MVQYTRETLYEEVWNEPVSTVAKKYGVSDVAIHKICKSMDIPVPPRGYEDISIPKDLPSCNEVICSYETE